MLYIDLQENLYAGLDYEKKQGLISLVFKRNQQALPTSDVSKICLWPKWRMSPVISAYFRIGSSFKANNVAGNNNYVGECFYND